MLPLTRLYRIHEVRIYSQLFHLMPTLCPLFLIVQVEAGYM